VKTLPAGAGIERAGHPDASCCDPSYFWRIKGLWGKDNRAMKHTLSFPKRTLEWPRVGLDIGVCEDGTDYTGFTVYGMPPDGEPRHFEIREPDGMDS